jgi:hypothetical protein
MTFSIRKPLDFVDYTAPEDSIALLATQLAVVTMLQDSVNTGELNISSHFYLFNCD